MEFSLLQLARYQYKPKLPAIFETDIHTIVAHKGAATESAQDQQALQKLFPHTYGLPQIEFRHSAQDIEFAPINIAVILSGGQAPGGHNVICGLFDALKAANSDSRLIGFKGGPGGILADQTLELTTEIIDRYRNTGGFDIIGSGRTKLESVEDFETVAAVCKRHNITALVIIGGDDSNTNAAVLAEYFVAHNHNIQVVGCPKTIDGDLKNELIEASFGFDTAVKTYSSLIGNIARDANSARKYWHFIKLMGRSASHIALECALQTQPNVCLISEEVEKHETTLEEIVDQLAVVINERAKLGKDFGVILVPEGLIEFIPEIKSLINELNSLLARQAEEFALLEAWSEKEQFVLAHLSEQSAKAFNSLPVTIREQLLWDRDPHGNVQVSRIETEKLLATMVTDRLAHMKAEGLYKGSFSTLTHFFGYEGRCAFPTNFDANYCYSLGYNAFLLLANGCTGYISSITNLTASPEQWKAGGVPLTMMMNIEERHGEPKPVIKKALVELDGKPFAYFAQHRDTWARETAFVYPGTIQYFGPSQLCDLSTLTLRLEHDQL